MTIRFCSVGVPAIMASSPIRDARYWPEERALELCFATGRRFLYLGVPPRVAESFVDAPSKGRFFNQAIKGRFLCHELASPAAPRRRRAAND
ncbi:MULTISPECIES: KTSC domain-containing protein [Sphingomonas]|uniref:KTSC domain-containing protein n=1 Tax=Sphingomonas TaxID=13687 RepID=UPI0019632892|nr:MULTISPECIES: KTSC domain-containing protein [Sphingomonas]